MSSHVIVDNHHVYHAHEQDTLLSEVVSSVCILLPRAFAIAGFGENGHVLIVKYNSYNADLPEWDAGFIEYEFLNEPLLAIPSQLKGLFVANEYSLAIPNDVFDVNALPDWLKTLHHFPSDSFIETYDASTDKLQYAYTLPKEIHAIAKRYFETTKILPLAGYQFFKPKTRKDSNMQCFISENNVIATLRNDGKLLWHQVFTYDEPTEIAWQFTHLCKQHQIHVIDLNIEATTPSESLYDALLELETFFPKITWSERQMRNEGHWAPTIFLMQQLYACVL